MAKLKRKIVVPKQKGKAKASTLIGKRKSESTVQQSSVWQSEVRALQGKVYLSVDEALETLVENVLQRLGSVGSRAAEEREFVRLLLETDPSIVSALRKSLKIK